MRASERPDPREGEKARGDEKPVRAQPKAMDEEARKAWEVYNQRKRECAPPRARMPPSRVSYSGGTNT